MTKPINNIEELEKLFQIGLGTNYFKVMSIKAVNHKPHPYTIGAGHVAYAADHFGGILGERAIEEYEKMGGHCAATGCQLHFNDHTFEYGLFLQPRMNIPNKTAASTLTAIKPLMEKNGIAGIAFVTHPEGFTVLPPNKKNAKDVNEGADHKDEARP